MLKHLTATACKPPISLKFPKPIKRATSSKTTDNNDSKPTKQPQETPVSSDDITEATETLPKRKTVAEQDEELRLKLEGISGDGGAAGLELEDGKPVAMKRGVKDNMFRLI